QRGLRDQLRDDFSPKMIRKMTEIIETIVANNRVLDKKDLWLIEHILRVIEFRLAIEKKDEKEQDRILIEINRGEKKGVRFFSKAEIWGANRVVPEKEKEANFGTFIKKLKERSKK
ncbi:MAG: hypothetical protein Q8N73_00080, partial [bacterium]|nr:hypothetical protein [bacterium]